MDHNFQGYDGYFILQYLHKNGLVPEVIMRGAKILKLNVPVLNIKFVDSLCFIPMRLANFPKTFGLSELAKGYFPHHVNIETNQNYTLPTHYSHFHLLTTSVNAKYYCRYTLMLHRHYHLINIYIY